MPVKKPNYTQVPNDIIDNQMKTLSGAELKVLLVITRKTIGWSKETDGISISQMEEITGLSNWSIINSVKSLEQKELIKCARQLRKTSIYQLWISEEISQEENSLMRKPHEASEKTSQDLPFSSEKISQTIDININKLNKENTKKIRKIPEKMPSIKSQDFYYYSDNAKGIEYIKKVVSKGNGKYLFSDIETGKAKSLISKLRKKDDLGNDVFDWEYFCDKWNAYCDDKFWADKDAKNLTGFYRHFNSIPI